VGKALKAGLLSYCYAFAKLEYHTHFDSLLTTGNFCPRAQPDRFEAAAQLLGARTLAGIDLFFIFDFKI
jgi:hypothetical protein